MIDGRAKSRRRRAALSAETNIMTRPLRWKELHARTAQIRPARGNETGYYASPTAGHVSEGTKLGGGRSSVPLEERNGRT